MKTFLGVHYPPYGRRNGLGNFLNAGAAGLVTFQCGYPVPVTNKIRAFAARVFGNQSESKLLLTPGASNWFYATRFQSYGNDNPENFYSDPVNTAWVQFSGQQDKWKQNPGAMARLSNNELDIETPWHAERQVVFYLEFMRLCETAGEKAGICNYSGGNPSDNVLLDGTPCSLEDRWRPMLPAVKYAGEHGHYVVLHIHQQGHGTMESPSGQQISLRHRRSIAYWLNNAAHPECVITKPPRIIFNEVSNGVGGVEPNEDAYINSVIWLDQQLRNDVYNSLYTVLALYQAGGAEPISERAYNRLADYIRSQGEIVVNPLPIVTPPPPDPIVSFRGTCADYNWDEVREAATWAGAMIEKVTP